MAAIGGKVVLIAVLIIEKPSSVLAKEMLFVKF